MWHTILECACPSATDLTITEQLDRSLSGYRRLRHGDTENTKLHGVLLFFSASGDGLIPRDSIRRELLVFLAYLAGMPLSHPESNDLTKRIIGFSKAEEFLLVQMGLYLLTIQDHFNAAIILPMKILAQSRK